MPEDIVAKVLHDFDEEDGLLVLQELQNLRSEGDNHFSDRILRAIVALAKGSLKQFDQAVELTRQDGRDTLVAAEGWACNALLMSHPFPSHLDEDVCRGWLVGQEVLLPWIKDKAPPWRIQANDIRELELQRLQREELADADARAADGFRASLRMLCVRGQPISSSPAFEIWIALRYRFDHQTKAFALRTLKYNPNEIKQRGKWE